MLAHDTAVEDLASEFTTSIRVSIDPTGFTPTVLTPIEDSAAVGNHTTEAVDLVAETSTVITEPIPATVLTTPMSRTHRRPSRRRLPAPEGSRKRTVEETEAAEAENASCKRHKHGQRYVRRQQLNLQDIVQDLMDNEGGHFLKDVDPDDCEPGWELTKELDIDSIEGDQRGFFKQFSLFLGGLKHHKLKNRDGTMQAAMHEKIKRHATAVNNLWRKAHRPIPFTYRSLIAEFLSNKRKKEKKLKADGDIVGHHSREAMSFELYRALGWYFLVTGNIFAHVFLEYCWNMMVRNCNCDDLNFMHVQWHQDALCRMVESTKTNKDGKRDGEQLVDKHIYANPLMPEICPILGLAMYLLVYPQVGTRKSKRLFPGKDTHVRFNEDIKKALANPSFRRYLINRGIPFFKIGAYSTRKGASTYCTSGTTAGPSVVVVCQRAGWSMGPTLERYLKNGQAGDQFCGRVVCGLPQLTWEFATLPPHFKDVGAGAEWDELVSALKIAFPYAKLWGPKFAPVCIYLLASLTHHYDWICEKLSVNHPVRQTRLFQGSLLPRLKPFLAVGKDVKLRPTGIPPWCVMFMVMNEIKEKVTGLRHDVKELPQTIKECIRQALHERDTENGTASMAVVRELLEAHTQQIAGLLDSRLQSLTVRGDISNGSATTASSLLPPLQDRYAIWFWAHTSGPAKYREMRGRYLPKDFRLCYDLKDKRRKECVDAATNPMITRKKVTVMDAWNFWFFGIPYGDKLIRPLYKLEKDPKFHFNLDNARKRYSDIKGLVKGMLHVLNLHGITVSVNATPQEIQELFPQAFNLMEKFIQTNHPNDWKDKTYKETCTCTTMKKHYYEAKKNAS